MKSILIFCGANSGANDIYTIMAKNVAAYFAKNNIELVYGGGNVGLMGVISNETMALGGKVTGIIPQFLLEKEVGNLNITRLITVDNMQERKSKMTFMADGIITLPGGYGSMDELFEVLTDIQLGQHQKPIGILNVNGFYDNLIAQLDTMVTEGFLKPENRNVLCIANEIGELVEKMKNHKPEIASKWIK